MPHSQRNCKKEIQFSWSNLFVVFLMSHAAESAAAADLGLRNDLSERHKDGMRQREHELIPKTLEKYKIDPVSSFMIECSDIDKLHFNLTSIYNKLQDTLLNLISNNCNKMKFNSNINYANLSALGNTEVVTCCLNLIGKMDHFVNTLDPKENNKISRPRNLDILLKKGTMSFKNASKERKGTDSQGPSGFLKFFRRLPRKCFEKEFSLFLRQCCKISTSGEVSEEFISINNRDGKQSPRLMVASFLKGIIARDIAMMLHQTVIRRKKSLIPDNGGEDSSQIFRLEIDGNNFKNEGGSEVLSKVERKRNIRKIGRERLLDHKSNKETLNRKNKKLQELKIKSNSISIISNDGKIGLEPLMSFKLLQLPKILKKNSYFLQINLFNHLKFPPSISKLFTSKDNIKKNLLKEEKLRSLKDSAARRVHSSREAKSLLNGSRLQNAKVKRSVAKEEISKSSIRRKEKSTILLNGEWSHDSSSGWLNDDWEEVESDWKDEGNDMEKYDEKASGSDRSKWTEKETSKVTENEPSPPFSEVHYISWKRNHTNFEQSKSGAENLGSPSSCLCWNTTDYGGKLEVECKCSRWNSNLLPPELDPEVQRITISDPKLKILASNSFKQYSRTLLDLVIMDASSLQTIETDIFQGLTNLQSFSIFNAVRLENLSNLNLNNALPKLRSMRILSSGLSQNLQMKIDDNHGIFSMIDFENNQIKKLETRSFRIKADQLVLNYNKITEIEEEAFYDSKIGKLSLKGNRFLESIHPNAFSGVRSIRAIDLSGTSITSLPTEGLEGIEELWLEDVPTLKVFPSVYSFKSIAVAHLTYPYHCCAFQFPQQHNPQQHQQYMAKLQEQEQELCSELPSATPVSIPIITPGQKHNLHSEEPLTKEDNVIHLSKRNRKPPYNNPSQNRHRFQKSNGENIQTSTPSGFETHHSSGFQSLEDKNGIKRASTPDSTIGAHFFYEEGVFLNSFGTFNDSTHFLGAWQEENYYESATPHNEQSANEVDGTYDWSPLDEVPPYHNSHGTLRGKETSHGTFHKTAANVQNETLFAFCGTLSKNYRDVTCYPAPDAFNPCEDIMGRVILRIGVWLVVILAVVGNLAVMLVLVSSRFKMTVSKFLMVNLAAADLCMGLYLLMIGAMDLHTMGNYFNYAIDWQNGAGCKLAGFLTVFASELSIFTLTLITSERWYAITYAINLNKRLKLSVARKFMCLGWIYSIAMGVLPILGVSGYSKTSICLPMDIRNGLSLAYLICLLVLNGLAFLVISACYVSMYCSISSHDAMATHSDLKVAKRMALLVFTDFACWAPIAFFGLTAVAGLPLINVSNSKILLVTFYPLNSCANPYLYAILTRQYRRDLFTLLERYGFCTQRAVRCTLTSPRSLDFRYKGAYSSVNNTHPNNMLANNSSVPQHRNSTQTQITLCDLSRLARASMQSQQGMTLTQGGLIMSQDSIPISVSPLRTPTKQVENQCCEVEKLTTVKETSHSSESSIQVDNFIVETLNDEISVTSQPKNSCLAATRNVDNISNKINSSLPSPTEPKHKDEEALLEVSKPKILVMKRKVANLNLNTEPISDINNETKIKFSKRTPRPKVRREFIDFDRQVANESDDYEADDIDDDDDYDESRVIIEAGSPHPLKNCYTSLVVSPEQQEILEKALLQSKKNRRKQNSSSTNAL